MFRPLVNLRSYAKPSRGRSPKLAAKVKSPGKGKTILAKRQRLSFKPVHKTVQPTTLDMGDFPKLSPVKVEERTVHKNLLTKVSSFKELRITPSVREKILEDENIRVPTAIQKVATKALRSTNRKKALQSWLLAAETGSGKTLAYLAPLLSNLVETPSPKGPCLRSVIFVPTLELIDQVGSVLEKFCPRGVFYACASTNSETIKKVVNGLDILVSTPDKFLNLWKNQRALADRALAHTRFCVVDEADSLMNQSFEPSTVKAISEIPELDDLVFCTATIPTHFDKALRKNYPETTRLITPSIHRLPRHIDFRVIEVWRPPYHDRKPLALEQALYSMYMDNSEPGIVKRVVVFVNKRDEVGPLVSMLKKSGHDAVGLDGTLSPNERADLLADFVNPPRSSSSKKLKVLIATDLVARGIDMNKIRTIILYDQPWSAADLLHRAGRTGRLNSKGRVLLFVSRKDAKGWVKGLEKVVKKGMALA